MRHIAFITAVSLFSAVALAQDAAPAGQAGSTPIIRAEKRLVLVDAVVTDKKGNYIRDLTAKDFKVWEDTKEQTISSVSIENDATAPAGSVKRYLVLFFDNSTMDTGDQMRARQAAGKFIDANVGPDRLMAIINFGGSVRIAQNFTSDADRLKKVVSSFQTSTVSPNAPGPAVAGMPDFGGLEREYGIRSVLTALRTVAKNLSTVQGRKTLVMLTSGFPLTAEARLELTAVINACNRANVAVYPIDVRGLVTPIGSPGGSASVAPAGRFRLAAFSPLSGGSPFVSSFLQRPGGGGGAPGGGGGAPGGGGGSTGGGTPGGGGSRGGGGTTGGNPGGSTGGGKSGGGNTGGGNTGGGRGTGGGNTGGGARGGGGGGNIPPNQQPYLQNPYANQLNRIIPILSDSVTGNQEVMYMLAQGTGGFVIVNSNDLVAGLEKIAHDQNEYYIISYTPPESDEGACHSIKVKVERGGSNVRARSGYCNSKPLDLLAGHDAEKELEAKAAAAGSGNVKASMLLPFFYTSPDTARVNVAMEIPLDAIKFEKKKGHFSAAMNILGIAYRKDGGVAARFSDTVNLNFDNKKELEAYQDKPFHYENELEIAPGTYTFKVVFSAGGADFGKVELPLAIDSYDGKKFSLSGLAFSTAIRQVNEMDTSLAAQMVEDRKPLIVGDRQLTPSGSNRFKKGDLVGVYAEVYEPLLASAKTPDIGVQLRIVDTKTGQAKTDTGFMKWANTIKPGNPVVPIGLKVPFEDLGTGTYRLEIKAIDSAGNATQVRAADFELL